MPFCSQIDDKLGGDAHIQSNSRLQEDYNRRRGSEKPQLLDQRLNTVASVLDQAQPKLWENGQNSLLLG